MKKKISSFIIALVLVLQTVPTYAAEPAQRYKDVPVDSEYYDAIEWMTEQNIVSGTGDGNFSPDSPLTIEQFTVIYMRLFYADEYSLGAATGESWADNYISAALFIGIYDDKQLAEMKEDGPSRKYVWEMLADATDLVPYPAWVYTDETPSVNFERDLEYAMYSTSLYKDAVDINGTPTRGETLNLAYRLIQNDYKKQAEPELWQNVNVIMESPICWRERNMAMYEWTLIPEKFTQSFQDNEWTLRFTGSMSNHYPEEPIAAGMTDFADKVITIAHAFNSHSTHVLIHEFGHYTMHEIQIPLTQKYMYETEKEQLAELTGSQYCKTNREEYAAEAFRYILLNRYNPSEYEKMRNQIPVTLNIIENGFLDCEEFVNYDAFVIGGDTTSSLPDVPSFQFKNLF